MTDLHTDVERYLRYLSVERQLSPITPLNYQRQLEAIINFASENGLQSWQQCDVTMVRNFAVRSRRKGLGAASLALRLSALRSFFDWLVSQNELKANPAKGVSAPKAPRHLPKNIDVDDMNRLLDIDINDPLAVRDRAMLEVMLNTSTWSLVKCGLLGKAAKSAACRLVATLWRGLSTGLICATCLVAKTTRFFCRNWASVSPRVMCRNALPNGA